MDRVLDIRNIHRTFSEGTVRALRGVTMSVDAGSLVAITGASGSGKTTLMNILGLLDTPTSGEYELDGFDALRLSRSNARQFRAQKIGFVFQDALLDQTRTALGNVELGLRFAGVAKKDRSMKAVAALHAVGLAHRVYHTARHLSGGEKQRVAIARAIAHEPTLLLCDEPTGALDEDTTRTVFSLISECARRGMAVVVVTHDLAVASACDAHARLQGGVVSWVKVVEETVLP